MQPAPGSKPAAAPPESAARSPKVLIAEDDPQGVELLEAYLADSGYEIRKATDGEATLRLINQWQPDLVLLDVMMPKISGFEVCKRLRANPATRDIAVLMITALDQASDVERAVEAGTDEFLTKPINKKDLSLRIGALLKTRSQKRSLERTLAYIEAVERADK